MDFRTKATLHSIDEALISTLLERSSGSVTVTEICKRAGINRATFYRYYKDIGDLFAQTKEGVLAKLDESISGDDLDLEERLYLMVEEVRKNKTHYAALFSFTEDSFFPMHVFSRPYERSGIELKDLLPGKNEAERRRAYSYVAYGLSALWRDWVEGGMAEPVHEVALFAFSLVQNGVGKLSDQPTTTGQA